MVKNKDGEIIDDGFVSIDNQFTNSYDDSKLIIILARSATMLGQDLYLLLTYERNGRPYFNRFFEATDAEELTRLMNEYEFTFTLIGNAH